MSDLSQRLAALSPEQRELLLRRLKEQSAIPAPSAEVTTTLDAPQPRIKPVSGNRAPLSFAQQRLWFIDQLEPNNPFYNVPRDLRIRGALDIHALEYSLNEVVRRHAVLRTTFSLIDGQPMQVIAPELRLSVPVIDLREVPDPERQVSIERITRQEAWRPFNLTRGPLLRATLLRIDEEEYILSLSTHHIVSDRWSVGIMVHEVATIYQAYVRGEQANLPELPIQYADYSVWQREWLQGAVLEQQLGYWKQQLAGAPGVLQLPTDYPRPAVQTFRGAYHTATIPADLHAALLGVSRREGATLFMTLLAAFNVLLSRYSGQQDIVVGAPIAGRQQVEVESLIGLFFNTLVLRTDLSDQPTFRDLLARVRNVTLGAYEHQDVPFEKLVEELRPERNLGHTPIFQVLFDLRNTPATQEELPGIVIEALPVSMDTTNFDLAVGVDETPEGLVCTFHYSTDLFAAATIERLADHFQTLLTGIAANPEQPITTLPLLTAGERHELLVTRNATAAPYPSDRCAHQLVQDQVARTPDATAAIFGDQQLTYAQLHARATQLAHALQALGVGPEVRVGVCLDRSLDLVVAILAIWQAGGAFVPLDPAFPPERSAFILADAQVVALLTQEHLRPRFADAGLPCLALDRDWDTTIAQQPTTPVVSTVTAANLAYLIYTSGSTGRPKGVLIPHQGLVNYLHWATTAYTADAGIGAPVQSSIAADAIFPSLFLPLLVGAAVVLLPESHALAALGSALTTYAPFSLIKITPSQLEVLNRQVTPDQLPGSVHTLVVGAEALRGEVLHLWQQHAPAVVLLNEYGPTETVVGCSIYPIPAGSFPTGPVPIGLPIANLTFYVLDAHLQPVPIGVPGELYIGGDGVAWGYHNRPDLTARTFVPDPFAGVAGARLYKTGDLVRALPDRVGNIEFLGRIDDQVKIRGYRVEPGEVEAVLAQHDAVQEVVVLARPEVHDASQKRLVAYLVPQTGVPRQSAAARRAARVPELWPSIGEYFLYDELIYSVLTQDDRRQAHYQAAIAQAVPGKVVLDLGTGKDAILARLCIEAGAERVYAIEVLDEAYREAQARIAELGLQDRIILVHGDAATVTLPEPVDVCVSQIIGVIGGAEGAATVLTDARRFLKPHGTMLPERCQTRIAAVTLPEPLASDPTLGEVAAYYTAQTFAQVGQPFDLRLCIKHFPLDHLRSTTDLLEDLDFRQPLPAAYQRPLHLEITSAGRLDGFLVWLNLHVGDGALIDTLHEEYAWLPVYFPAFDPPLDVQPGDRLVGTVWGGPQTHPTQPDYGVRGEVIRADGQRVPFAYTSAYATPHYRANAFYDRLFATTPTATPPAAAATGDVVGTVRRYAQDHLPEYMVPSAFVVLDALPLTPHGKLDRHALPAPELAQPEPGSAFVAPRTLDEELLAGIWAQVLQVQRVGRHDNFFDLGGHSLLATQVITRIRDTFGTELPLRALFETPTVAGMVPTITRARSTAPSQARPPLTRVARDLPLPLSFAQQRLWFLDQLEPGSPAYNVPVAVKILGTLNPEALEHSLNALVARHEILRTIFASQGGQPIQVILPQQSLALDRHDLHDLPAAEREAEALRLMHESARQPFNLSRDSLVRVLLVRLSDREHLLALTMHHIVADEWSLGVIIREIAAFYQGYVRGQTITLPELPIQYADYSVWQREWLSGQVLEEQLGYWKQQLAGAPGVLQLPTDYPRPAVQTFRGARHTLALPAELSTALQQLSRQEGVTLFMTLLAAFKVLLARYSGQTDLVVGVPIAGRQQVEAESLIGLFFNTTVLRTDLGGQPTFRDLLARVQSVALSAYDHQDVPFEQLVDHLHINRDLGQNPLFQVLFDLHNTPTTTTTEVADLQFQSLPISTDTVKVDLALGVDETVQGLVCTFHYSTDLFAAATIERLATHYATLLQAVVATPNQPITTLPLLTAGERHELLVTRNATAAPYPSDRCAHQLVQDQVARTPDATAAIFGEQQLTYAQLEARATQLAHTLQALGVGPEVRVGVCLDRSLDLVVAILAIWHAGGAFVPLDPAFPPERSAFILADAQVVALLTQEHLRPRFADAGLPCLALDRDWDTIARQPTTPVHSAVTAANLAYLIYTSGSTGRPKGVLIPHQGLVNYLHWATTAYTADAGIGAPVQSSIAADAIFPSLFLPLLVGAAVVLLPESHALAALGSALTTYAPFSLIKITPSQLEVLNRQVTPDQLPGSVHTLVVGAEALRGEVLHLWQQHAPEVVLLNEYGPTETVVGCSIYPIPAGSFPTGPVPIGLPIANLTFYVLDAHLQPVPIGVPGELYIGGDGVAWGYHNRPDLTARTFVPDPFAGVAGARLYKTGDLVRALPDRVGNIEFLGRIDDQVKIRGYRVEPGEVEAVLAQHDAVQEVVVLARPEVHDASQKRLVAYLVPQAGVPRQSAAARRAARVPDLWPSIGEYFLYDELIYSVLTQDDRRQAHYQAAIAQAVPGKVVLDLGTGKDAILARLCIEAGAERVYAIEVLDEAYAAAHQRIAELGLQDRIILVHGDAASVTLPEPVDVCVSQIIGVIGGAEGAATVLTDARRFLKPDGTMLPERCATRIAAVTLPEPLASDPTLGEVAAYYTAQTFAQVGQPFDLRLCIKHFPLDHLRSTTDLLEDLDFRQPLPAAYQRPLHLEITSAGRLDGFLVWLNLQVGDGALIDTLHEEYAWLPVYFPAFDPPLDVQPGDRLVGTVWGGPQTHPTQPDYGVRGEVIRADGQRVPFAYTSAYATPHYRANAFYDRLFAIEPTLALPAAATGDVVGTVRRYAQDHLPEYMVPSAFVVLDALPLTPHGKLDRHALPAPELAQPEPGSAFVAPRTLDEELLAGIWAQVLQVQRVGRHDNFFDLGGHSLLATQVITRIRDTFGTELPLRALFETPTVAGMVPTITRTRGVAPSQARPPLTRVARDLPLPLSFAQQRLWFLDQLQPESTAYNVSVALQLTGSIDIAALEQSLSAVVARHEVLRTNFITIGESPVQVIAPAQAIRVPQIDLADQSAAERAAAVRRQIAEEARRPFDLAQDSLFRVQLLRLAEVEHVLLLTIHHAVADGWSMNILVQEVAVLYQGFVAGENVTLPELPIQYADYAVWQRQWLDPDAPGAALEQQLNYWRRQLGGTLPVLALPTDYPRTAASSFRGDRQTVLLSQELSTALTTLSQREGVTLFMTLLAAFQMLLGRYSGQEDIIVGSPIAGRNQPETQDLIGCFLNTLALRGDLSGNPSFAGLLRRVREVCLGAYAHQDVPFEKLVEELGPDRDLSRNPIFEVVLNFGNTPRTRIELPDVSLSALEQPEIEAKYLITLYAAEWDGRLELDLVYQQAVFSAERIEHMLDQLTYLLEQIAADPAQPIQSYSLVTPASQALLPNPSAALAEPDYDLVAGMFAAWVARQPDRAAIACGEQAWSYVELATSARGITRALVEHGLERGDVVAVVGSRQFGLVASVLGVLSSNGVLLIVDRGLPAQRQRQMIQEGRARYLLHIGERRPEEGWMDDLGAMPILTVDGDTGRVHADTAGTERDLARHAPLPSDAAYIFFTSGTTGVPKGILGNHKGLSHFLHWQRETFAVGPQDRSAQLTSLSFDVVMRDMLLPLVSGALLCLPEPGLTLASHHILPWMEREQITLLHTVPTLAQSWLADLPQGLALTSLRWTFFAGEPLSDVLVRRWRETFVSQIANLYGPTETTLAKCCYQVGQEPQPGVQPVGWPLPQTQALVLSADNRLCGIGEPGEIVIRTPFRTYGYLNATEEQAQRFVKNPFRADERDLIYRTGDRGCYRLDGSLDILGRVDHQIKIRGVRVEPGEIESVLRQHPAVVDAVVVARKDDRGDTRLVGYVVAEGDQRALLRTLRGMVRQQLPESMVPSAFVLLERLPLTPNGKVDRAALPTPTTWSDAQQSYCAPRDSVELKLVQIWEEALKVEPIGVLDNFFDLGGHSLLAIQLMSQIERAFGQQVALTTLFQEPTIEQLAGLLRQDPGSRAWSPLVPLQPRGSQPPLFLAHPAGGTVFCYMPLAHYLGTDQPVYGLQIRGLEAGQELHQTIEAMAAEYVAAIKTAQPRGPYRLAGWSMGGLVAFEIAQQLVREGAEVEFLGIIDTHAQSPWLLWSEHETSDSLDYDLVVRIAGPEQITLSREEFEAAGLEEQLSYALEAFQKLRFVPPDTRPDYLLRFMHMFDANGRATDRYRAQPYPNRITLFKAERNDRVPTKPDVDVTEPTMGWGQVSTQPVEVHLVPGTHSTMILDPHVRTLAERLSECIASLASIAGS